MANTKSAAKRARQTARRFSRNRSALGRIRTVQKRALSGEKPDATEIRNAISEIDRAVKRGIIHRNAAIHRKTRLTKALAASK